MSAFTHRDIIAANVRRARRAADLTMKQAAARMRGLGYGEWSYQTFGHVEKCNRRVMAEELVGLALALDTTVRSLLSPGGDSGVTLPSGDEVDGEAMAAMLDGREAAG